MTATELASCRRLSGMAATVTVGGSPRAADSPKGSEPKSGGKRFKRRCRGKVTPRVMPETEVLRVAHPAGPQFKGYEPYQGQDLVPTARVERYRRERWLTPQGETIVAPLPSGIHGYFGPELRRFVLMQYHQGQVNVGHALKA